MTITDDLQAHVNTALMRGIHIEDFRGGDWWQLDEAEDHVFGLELAAMPLLVEVWSLFEAIADVAHNDFWGTPLCDAAMRALPFIKPRHLELEAWVRFAGMLCIPSRAAFAWYWKHHFWDERARLITRFDDDIALPWRAAAGDDELPF